METKETKRIFYLPVILIIFLQFFILPENSSVYAQNSSTDIARYTPNWIKDGFADAMVSDRC
jgi:hypothetical protein